MDNLFKAIARNPNRSVVYHGLENYKETLALPINVSLRSLHWTIATVSGRNDTLKVTYVDPLTGEPDNHARRAIELVPHALNLRRIFFIMNCSNRESWRQIVVNLIQSVAFAPSLDRRRSIMNPARNVVYYFICQVPIIHSSHRIGYLRKALELRRPSLDAM
jgi:hypothetical protein